ncbi:MAG TPA: energy transducer TonB [Pyrinomonadaceae bacterium]|jgi:TonB family protein
MTRHTIRLSLLLLLLCLAFALPVSAQEAIKDERRLIDNTSEGWGRSWATKKVLPLYPAEAVRQNLQGVVEVGVGINDDGRVIKVRVPPGLDVHLRKATVAAVKQWEFREWENKMEPGGYCIFRLTFNFIIEEGAARVELYSPPWDSPAHRRIRGTSGRDRKEWLAWEDATEDH